MNVSKNDFGLRSDEDCIRSQRNKDKYTAYQDAYREEFGVYPELDLKNCPFTALRDEPYAAYTALKRRGFYGAWFYHDIHGFFNRRCKKIYHAYKKEWSFWVSINYPNRELVTEITKMSPCERIQNDLGYRVDQNGDYYEGTWENGKLIYGLIYFAAEESYFVGSIRYGNENSVQQAIEYDGLHFTYEEEKNKTWTLLSMGVFFTKKGTVSPYRDLVLSMETVARNDKIEQTCARIAAYEDGYMNGSFYEKTFSDDIYIFCERYRDGQVTYSPGAGFKFLHMLLALYMMPYYMIKYTYGLLIFPIYRAVQKKKWQ